MNCGFSLHWESLRSSVNGSHSSPKNDANCKLNISVGAALVYIGMYLVYVCITVAVGGGLYVCLWLSEVLCSLLGLNGSEPFNTTLIRDTHVENRSDETLKAVSSRITFLCSFHFLFLLYSFSSSNKIWATNWTRMSYLNFFQAKLSQINHFEMG